MLPGPQTKPEGETVGQAVPSGRNIDPCRSRTIYADTSGSDVGLKVVDQVCSLPLGTDSGAEHMRIEAAAAGGGPAEVSDDADQGSTAPVRPGAFEEILAVNGA